MHGPNWHILGMRKIILNNMLNKKNVNFYLKNYSKNVDVSIATRIKILNAFSNKLMCVVPKEQALLFDDIDLENLYVSEQWINNFLDKPDTFSVNSNNFRSDEFKKEHKGKHILFAGCSISYGSGLYVNETWPHLLYNKIKEKEKVSGYYNISVPASSIFSNISNIFKYVNHYSRPDIIFINLPDIFRFYSLVETINENPIEWKDEMSFKEKYDFNYFKDKYYHTFCNYSENNIKSAIIYEKLIYIYEYLLMLEVFCKVNNIQLYLFSWSEITNKFLTSNSVELNSFYKIQPPSKDFIYDYKIKNKEDKFYLKARDNMHHGTAYHDYWSQEMYNIYMKGNYVY